LTCYKLLVNFARYILHVNFTRYILLVNFTRSPDITFLLASFTVFLLANFSVSAHRFFFPSRLSDLKSGSDSIPGTKPTTSEFAATALAL
jgi:hypothetical protein